MDKIHFQYNPSRIVGYYRNVNNWNTGKKQEFKERKGEIILNWNEYTKKALSTSTHVTREKRISCCLFGLFGETWEYLEKKGLKAPEEELKHEMGDRFWYLSILSYDINHIPKIIDVSDLEGVGSFPILAKLQEVMKKDYRDFDYTINEKYREKIHYYTNVVYTFMCDEVNKNGWLLFDILQMNIDKLEDRKKRNVLKGEGDNR